MEAHSDDHRLLNQIVALALLVLTAAAPATQQISPSLATRSSAPRSSAGGTGDGWPDHLPAPAAPASNLTYDKPSREVAGEPLLAAATVSLHEPTEQHPDGVWVGYADGHLEFAPDAATLAACQRQSHIARIAIPIRNALRTTTRPSLPPASGQLILQVVDADGKPVAGAAVGVFRSAGDTNRIYVNKDSQPTAAATDQDGKLTLSADEVFVAKFSGEDAVPLWVLDDARGRAHERDGPAKYVKPYRRLMRQYHRQSRQTARSRIGTSRPSPSAPMRHVFLA